MASITVTDATQDASNDGYSSDVVADAVFWTWADLSIGTADADRIVRVWAYTHSSAGVIPNMFIDGVEMTRVVLNSNIENTGGIDDDLVCYSLAKPAGTTATFTMKYDTGGFVVGAVMIIVGHTVGYDIGFTEIIEDAQSFFTSPKTVSVSPSGTQLSVLLGINMFEGEAEVYSGTGVTQVGQNRDPAYASLTVLKTASAGTPTLTESGNGTGLCAGNLTESETYVSPYTENRNWRFG